MTLKNQKKRNQKSYLRKKWSHFNRNFVLCEGQSHMCDCVSNSISFVRQLTCVPCSSMQNWMWARVGKLTHCNDINYLVCECVFGVRCDCNATTCMLYSSSTARFRCGIWTWCVFCVYIAFSCICQHDLYCIKYHLNVAIRIVVYFVYWNPIRKVWIGLSKCLYGLTLKLFPHV